DRVVSCQLVCAIDDVSYLFSVNFSDLICLDVYRRVRTVQSELISIWSVQFGNVAWKPDAAILVPWAGRLCQSVHVSDRSLLIYDGTWAENGEDISDIATLGYFILK